MRFIVLLATVLLLVTSCDNQPFKSSEQSCEEQLFGPLDSPSVNSSSITINADQTNSHRHTVTAEIDPGFSASSDLVTKPANDSIPLRYVIEKTHGVLQGGFTEVDIMMPKDGWLNYPIGGFDFLITYDASALAFQGAEAGSFIENCGWEYFTWRTGPVGNCGSACPSGMVKVVGLAETNNGNNHPVAGCTNTEGNEQIAKLTFYVSNDRNLECQFVPIRFLWIDCSNNSVSDEAGQNLFWGNRIFDYNGPVDPSSHFQVENYTELVVPAGESNEFPSIYGPTTTCDSIVSANNDIYRYIDFFNGGIDIVCADSIDDRCMMGGCRGDLDGNGLPYTIADAVTFSNYFIQGLSAFPYIDYPNQYGVIPGYAGSIAASDVNADGLTLGVADLVYLIRVIIGDTIPPPNIPLIVNAYLRVTEGGTISIDQEMGAAFTVFEGEVHPTLLADNMEMKYQFDGVNTRVLVWSLVGESFTGEFLQADAEIVSVEMATSEGHPVRIIQLPNEILLEQNYPDPFTDVTTIRFALPEEAEVSTWIYNNATCEIVASSQDTLAAGTHHLSWVAIGNEPGEYVFRLTVGDVTQSITMTLVK